MTFTEMVTEAFNLLVAGKSVEAVIYPYTYLMSNIFYALMVFLGLTMIYIKTQDYGTVGVVGALVAVGSIAYMPIQVHLIAAILLSLSLTIVVFKVFWRK